MWSHLTGVVGASSCAPRRLEQTATRGTPGRRTSHRRRRSSNRGSLTTRSGRRRLSSVATWACVSKSQCASIPAISTTRLSWISPQRPRTLGRSRRALTSSASRCGAGSASRRAGEPGRSIPSTRGLRATSSCCSFPSTFWRDSAIGVTRCSTACLRCSSSWVVCCWSCSRLRLGELHEGLVVRRERIRGECLQRGAERGARLLERGHPAGVLGPQHDPGSRGARPGDR